MISGNPDRHGHNAAGNRGAASPVLVTGGAGFIGSAVVRRLMQLGQPVVVVDKLTYAGNMESLASVSASSDFCLERVDICDAPAIRRVFERHRPSAVMHLAAESHVDRSIDGPAAFIETNVLGTFVLLEAARDWMRLQDPAQQAAFRFLHVSTDEVFGSLDTYGRFDESTPYDPRSPYSASKAGSDHLARAWYHTYGLPVVVTNCSNNYGPYQFPEKLIPLMVLNALDGHDLPVYGNGQNVRDWIHVDDHVAGLLAALERGTPGKTYLLGGRAERRNLEVVQLICDLVDELAPATSRRQDLIRFVQDRPGHDFRYAIDPTRAETELGWRPIQSFESGLRATVEWYMENREWCERVQSGAYRRQRLGLSA